MMESSVRSRAEAFVQQSQGQRKSNATENPFVQVWDAVVDTVDQSQEGYGRPPEGSLTEARGIKAHLHVHREIEQLCEIIKQFGVEVKDGWLITFGQVFNIYVTISDKVVGLLLRARKHGLVDFEGEMLYQRRDEGVTICLRRTPRTPSASPCPSRSPSPAPFPTLEELRERRRSTSRNRSTQDNVTSSSATTSSGQQFLMP